LGENCPIAVDEVAAFDSQENGDSPGRARVVNLLGRGGQREIIRMNFNLTPDCVDLSERLPDGFRTGDRTGRPNSEKDRAYSALPQTWNIHRAFGLSGSQVEAINQQTLGCIDVRIYDERVEMEITRLLGENYRVDRFV
jgi:hypothetical protein